MVLEYQECTSINVYKAIFFIDNKFALAIMSFSHYPFFFIILCVNLKALPAKRISYYYYYYYYYYRPSEARPCQTRVRTTNSGRSPTWVGRTEGDGLAPPGSLYPKKKDIIISTILKTIIVPSQMGAGTGHIGWRYHMTPTKSFREYSKIHTRCEAPSPSAKRERGYSETLEASGTSAAITKNGHAYVHAHACIRNVHAWRYVSRL